MRKLKQALSLSLAFVLSLALAVPAFANSTNGYTDPAAENVEFSAAPIGVATIQWDFPEPYAQTVTYTAYVFDQDCVVTRKDGLPLTMVNVFDYTYGSEATGQIDSSSWWPYQWVKSASLSADDDSTMLFQFSPERTSDGIEDWSPFMISKKSIDTFPIEYTGGMDDYLLTGTILEYRSLSEQPAAPSQPATPTTPVVTVENIPASGTAVASTQTVTVDGKAVEFQMYALVDENGNGTNYIKLRDMAHVLNGTQAQFSVGYSNEAGISATSGQPYQDTGSEMSTPFSGDRAYTGGGQSIQINGSSVEMTAISLLDDNGGGYTYFKLRDLGAALGFNVGWSAEQGIYVETDKT